jgi:hypothetical protein
VDTVDKGGAVGGTAHVGGKATYFAERGELGDRAAELGPISPVQGDAGSFSQQPLGDGVAQPA